MSRLTDLLRQLHEVDPRLGADLESEIQSLTSRRTFGLVFERHQPEAVELPGIAPRRGSKVHILEPRGSKGKGDKRLWHVKSVSRSEGLKIAHLVELYAKEPEEKDINIDDLVVVAEFKDVIYPGLVETGRVERGGDKPFHTVINAENFHALEMLTYTHRGKVDCIYIDPPYNTGAKDWKYNNDYVEADDAYRHSKWLAMMERRLLVAKELLNPQNSVLIVTIDEKEYLRLGMLLEQTFPEAHIQMVSVSVNPAAVARSREFGRTDEYYYFVMIGTAGPQALNLPSEWITTRGRTHKGKIRWDLLRRSGTNTQRHRSPGTFYPFFLHEDGSGIHSIGDALPLGQETSSITPPEGTVAIWPFRRDGSEGVWQMTPENARRLVDQGFMKQGVFKGESTTIYYIKPGERRKIEQGIYSIVGREPDGSVIVSEIQVENGRTLTPGTQWKIAGHDASQYGSRLLLGLLPGRKFPFPKSLYAVEDALRFFVADKPDAVILDFFSGSGTTAHAVMRLNKQDGGRRQCISVTNNEVSDDEQKQLRKHGLRPGDPEWEELGICDYITKPRITAAITGHTPDGEPIKGEYKFTDEFPMVDGFEENAVFFTLTYESPLSVRHGRGFERVAPMLWLRAGSQGRIIESLDERGWEISDVYGVLENFNQSAEFFAALADSTNVRTVYFVTDDDAVFQMACRKLPETVEPVQLYSSYLQNFEINRGRA